MCFLANWDVHSKPVYAHEGGLRPPPSAFIPILSFTRSSTCEPEVCLHSASASAVHICVHLFLCVCVCVLISNPSASLRPPQMEMLAGEGPNMSSPLPSLPCSTSFVCSSVREQLCARPAIQ